MRPKQYELIAGRSLFQRAIDAFLRTNAVDAILPVIGANAEEDFEAAVEVDPRVLAPVHGGRDRQESVLCGLRALRDRGVQTVLVHDAARPFISAGLIDEIAKGARNHATVPGLPVVDTLKYVEGDAVVTTRERDSLLAAQTPQGFSYDVLLDAHERASPGMTDDAAVLESVGVPVHWIKGDPDNVKITTPEDLDRARRIAERELGDIRMGQGYDVHAFGDGASVWLGGIEIPYDRGLSGHSDADVALHALTDAILAALADGDIGHHFPPSDEKWRGARSDQFLRFAAERVRRRGGAVRMLDVTLVCEEPKIGPHRDAMRERIAEIAGLGTDRVSVKATTSERLGFTGRREGIAALACATIALPL